MKGHSMSGSFPRVAGSSPRGSRGHLQGTVESWDIRADVATVPPYARSFTLPRFEERLW